MSTGLAVIPGPERGLTVAEAQTLANTIAQSGLIPEQLQKRPADILIVLLTGQELGLAPMQAVRSLSVIKGKAVMSAELMVALCKRRSDICEYFRYLDKESTPDKAVYEAKRKGDPEPTKMSFSVEDAKRAGLLGSQTYQKYQANMLRWRCASNLAKVVFPDLVLGVYETSEGEEIAAQEPRITPPPPPKPMPTVAEVVDVTPKPLAAVPDPTPEPKSDGVTEQEELALALKVAASHADMQKLVPRIAKQPDDVKAVLRMIYGQRQKELVDAGITK